MTVPSQNCTLFAEIGSSGSASGFADGHFAWGINDTRPPGSGVVLQDLGVVPAAAAA